MPRILVRLLLPLITLFAAALLLIRAQPFDDGELRALLLPEGCPAPCFMGIRPGVTTAKEAMMLLKNHAWVAEVVTINAEKPYQIWWTWSKNVPGFLRNAPTNSSFPVNGEVHSTSEIVSSIQITLGLTLGDMALIWGLPRESQLIFGGVIIAPSQSNSAISALPYETHGFWASGTTECPYIAHLWYTPARLRITNEFHGLSLGTVILIDGKTFLNSIRRASNLMCGL